MGHENNGDHFADEDVKTQKSCVTSLKGQEELETEMKTCLPSAQYFVAIPCQVCQACSPPAYYPPVSSQSAPFWQPDWQSARSCVFTHLCSLGPVSCCLVPRVTEPKGRGREHSVLTHAMGLVCDRTYYSWQPSEMGIISTSWMKS